MAKQTNDEHVTFEDQTEERLSLSRNDSFSSSYELTPSSTPPGYSPKLSRRTLQLSEDDSTWSFVPKNSKFKFNFNKSATKVHSLVMKGRGPDAQFKFVVGILFLIIFIIILSTSYFYKKELLLVSVQKGILFLKEKRKFEIVNNQGNTLLRVSFGHNIPMDISPILCDDNDICFDWKFRSKLQIDHKRFQNGIKCFNVSWQSYNLNAELKDCFDLYDAFWYGMGQVNNLSWPFNKVSVKSSPFVTSHQVDENSPFGSLIRRFWITSNGIAITVPLDVPLFVSFNQDNNNQMCLEAKINQYPYYSRSNLTPSLNYSICAGANAIQVYNFLNEQHYKEDNHNLNQYFERFIWSNDLTDADNFSQNSLQNFADKIMNYGFEPGFIVLNLNWEKFIGDFEINNVLLPNPSTTLNILHNKGFKVLSTITPNIEISANIFREAFLTEKIISDEKLDVPLLTRCGKELENLCVLIDLTDVDTRNWFKNRIQQLKKQLSIDGFIFINGQSSLTPTQVHEEYSYINPDNYLVYYKQVAQESSSTMGLSSCPQVENFNGFVNIKITEKSWTTIKSIIPTILTLGLIGYPFVSIENLKEIYINDKELQFRWLQLTMFLPLVQLNEQVLNEEQEFNEQIKSLLKIRETRLMNEFGKSLYEYKTQRIPIVRPMWWVQVDSKDAYKIDKQFAIGNDLIVAPVLQKNKTEIDIYLPSGWWQDEMNHQIVRGGKWMKNYQVPIDKIAYFLRIETNIKSD